MFFYALYLAYNYLDSSLEDHVNICQDLLMEMFIKSFEFCVFMHVQSYNMLWVKYILDIQIYQPLPLHSCQPLPF